MNSLRKRKAMKTPKLFSYQLSGNNQENPKNIHPLSSKESDTHQHNADKQYRCFGEAKKELGEILQNLLKCMEGLEDDTALEIELEESLNATKTVQTNLENNQMKVCFFGRTSNGKSSVINAMLGQVVVPKGIGHTTNCFIQVEGCDGEDGKLCTKKSEDQELSIQAVTQLASALSTSKLEENSLLRIKWPKKKCSLLQEQIVFIDSPGIDHSECLDKGIIDHCMDADVFVLVANAESTLSMTERKYFDKVLERFWEPNIILLYNRWDLCMDEENADKVRNQLMEYGVELCNKIKCKGDPRSRVFFVSAKETLGLRLYGENKLDWKKRGDRSQKQEELLDQFEKFEAKFKECTSESAVKAKLERHVTFAENKCKDIRQLLQKKQEDFTRQREEEIKTRKELRSYIKINREGYQQNERDRLDTSKKIEKLKRWSFLLSISGGALSVPVGMLLSPPVGLFVGATAALGGWIYERIQSYRSMNSVEYEMLEKNLVDLERNFYELEKRHSTLKKKVEASEENVKRLNILLKRLPERRKELDPIEKQLVQFRKKFLPEYGVLEGINHAMRKFKSSL